MLLPLNASRLLLPAVALLGSLTLSACSDSEARPGEPAEMGSLLGAASEDAAARDAAAQPDPQANRFAPGGPISDADLSKYYISMTCEVDGEDVGTMTFDMWTEAAPITTRNFLRLTDEGFYDGLTFHRILREFMVQGGDPQGTGMGGSPHGNIKAEFSEAPERQHGYGVLSMARGGHDINSASSQFFLCCDESQSVWGLDGKYASFGRLTSGVKTLETLAEVPVARSATGEVSRPTKSAKITSAKVVEGEAPTGETVERPEPEIDLGGEPRRVRIQQIVVGFKGMVQGVKATRSEEEARALATKLAKDIEEGADMSVLVREYTELPFEEVDEVPGDYRVLNRGVRDRAGERKQFNLFRSFQKRAETIQADMNSAKIKRDEFQKAMEDLQKEFNAAQVALGDALSVGRQKLDPMLGDAAFTMEVGDVIVLDHDAAKRAMGYRVVKRLE